MLARAMGSRPSSWYLAPPFLTLTTNTRMAGQQKPACPKPCSFLLAPKMSLGDSFIQLNNGWKGPWGWGRGSSFLLLPQAA